jgi:predicted component of type VI protein secretion system
MSDEKFRLVMSAGPNPGKVFELNMDSLSIGREAVNDIVIQEAELSRNHARISRRGATFLLEDLGSTNGTFVNHQRISSPRMLNPGDEVGFGENVVLSFQGEGAAATVAAPGRGQAATRQPAPPPPAPKYAPPPPQYAAVPAKTGGFPLWLGCLLVIIFLCIIVLVGGYLFDSANLYCTPPFNTIFGLITTCG